MAEKSELAASFDQEAELYERTRPSYPSEVVDWLFAAEPRRVLDVGAGTGKLTRLIPDSVDVVAAVDPSERMLEQLRTIVPRAEVHIGTAEHLPVDADSFDAMVVAQAWHWVEPVPAFAEADRVLRPGGTLTLLWNLLDDSVEWTADLARIARRSIASRLRDKPPRALPPFSPFDAVEWRWSEALSVEGLIAREMSASQQIVATASEKQDIGRRLEALLRGHTTSTGMLEVPYVTLAFRTQRPG